MRNVPRLERRVANFRLLSPVDVSRRVRPVHPDRLTAIWQDRHLSCADHGRAGTQVAHFLRGQGFGPGNVRSVKLPNRPEMLALHCAVPRAGAVWNEINTRPDSVCLDRMDPADTPPAKPAKSVGQLSCAPVPQDSAVSDGLVLFGSALTAGCCRDAPSTKRALHGGTIEIRDRAGDVVSAGLEVKNALRRQLAVLLAAVGAGSGPEWAAAPCAVVKVKQAKIADADTLQMSCKRHIAQFKLPRTVTGTMRKFIWRDLARPAA